MIDKTSPIPLYHQVMQSIKDKIKSKQYKVGGLIPSEVELINKYHVSRMTVRLAIEGLEKDGYVKKVQGKGTYVRSPKVTQELGVITSWSETMRAQGKNPVTKKMKTKEIVATEELAEQMEIEPGVHLYYIERLRLAEDEPISLAKMYIVADMAPGFLEKEGIDKSVYKVMEESYNIELSTATEIVEAFAADSELAQVLEVKEGAPIISVTRLTYGPLGKPIEMSIVSTRAEKYAYKVTLKGRGKQN